MRFRIRARQRMLLVKTNTFEVEANNEDDAYDIAQHTLETLVDGWVDVSDYDQYPDEEITDIEPVNTDPATGLETP